MTVCIAAICEQGRFIVSASDTMLSLGGVVAADSSIIKGRSIYDTWVAMYSSNGVGRVLPILESVSQTLAQQMAAQRIGGRLPARPHPASAEQVRSAFDTVCRAVLKQARASVLAVYELDMATFVRDGLLRFGEAGFNELRRRIEAINLGCEFLVHGFDQTRVPHVFVVEPSGEIRGELTEVEFDAIGSGAGYAQSSLFFHSYRRDHPLALAVYRVCEAKFMAESAQGVGRDTVLVVLGEDRRYRVLSGEAVEPIRRMVEQGRQVPVPLVQQMQQFIASGKWGSLP